MTKPDKSGQLTPEQLNAIELLILGKTDTEAAQAAGVARQTVWTWRNDNPEFIAELNRRRAEIWTGQTERLRTLASQALTVLGADLESEDARLRQAAAVHILRAAGRYGVPDSAPVDPQSPSAIQRENLFKNW